MDSYKQKGIATNLQYGSLLDQEESFKYMDKRIII